MQQRTQWGVWKPGSLKSSSNIWKLSLNIVHTRGRTGGSEARGRAQAKGQFLCWNPVLSDGGKSEQTISQVGLTLHLLSEVSSSVVSNVGSGRKPESSLLNGRAPWALRRGYSDNTNVVSFLWSPDSSAPRQAGLLSCKHTGQSSSPCSTPHGICPRSLPHKAFSLTHWQNSVGCPLKTLAWEQWRAPPTRALITPLICGSNSEVQ